MTRSGPIDVAALQRRREAFLGALKDREARARGLITPGRGAGSHDLEDAQELVRRVPLPFLTALADEGFVAKVERNPGERLLRELATAIDRALGRGGTTWSEASVAFTEALAGTPGYEASPPHEAFVEVYGRWIGHDATLAHELPALAAAVQSMLDAELAVEEARVHPERIKRVMGFLRAHVLKNPRLSESARVAVTRRAQRDRGPWDQVDVEKHAKGVREQAGQFVVDTRWGAEPYPLVGAPDAQAERARVALFLEKLVRTNARISPKGRARLERSAALAYGPWRSQDFEAYVTGIFETRGRFVVQTKAGNVTIEVAG